MKEKGKKKAAKSETRNEQNGESATAFPKPDDEAVHADPLKRREPQTKRAGERLEDYLG